MSRGNRRPRPPRDPKQVRHATFARMCGGALAFSLLMIVGLVLLLCLEGMSQFWPKEVQELELADGSRVWGLYQDREEIRSSDLGGEVHFRRQYKIANRDLEDLDFRWIDEADIRSTETPPDLIVLERMRYGDFIGRVEALEVGGTRIEGPDDQLLPRLEGEVMRRSAQRAELLSLERGRLGDIAHEMTGLRFEEKRLRASAERGVEISAELARLQARLLELDNESQQISEDLLRRREDLLRDKVVMETARGRTHEIAIGDIVEVNRVNDMGPVGKVGAWLHRLWGFLWDQPRESNTEGGIFPAIFGTVMMVFLMTIFVTPFGVLAAIYLREYAKEGALVRAVRIAINNLAGVPSIVFGVFGLGFFVYLVGGSIDDLFYPERSPTPTFGTGGILWAALTLALLTVPVVIVATEEALAAVPQNVRQGSYALGATRFETLWRIVVPASVPGILTGVILAIARAAGEVAPLMIVGMVKLAPELPVDHHFPFVHLERKFMHLGFHIYDLGFQSPNVEATRPLVYATAFLLVVLVLVMNLVAIRIRNRLRDRFASSHV